MDLLLASLVFLLASSVFAFVHFNAVQKLKAIIGKLESEKDQLERKLTSLTSQVENLRRTEEMLKEQLEEYKVKEGKKNAATGGAPPPPEASGLGAAIDLMLREGVLDKTKLAKAATYKSDTRSDMPIEDMLVMLDMVPGETVEVYKQRAKALQRGK